MWMNCLYCMVLGYILIMTSFYFSVKFHFLILVVRNLFILSNIEKQKKVRCRLASEMGSITSNNNQNVENTDSTSVANDNAANSESSAASQATAKSSTPVVGMIVCGVIGVVVGAMIMLSVVKLHPPTKAFACKM